MALERFLKQPNHRSAGSMAHKWQFYFTDEQTKVQKKSVSLKSIQGVSLRAWLTAWSSDPGFCLPGVRD